MFELNNMKVKKSVQLATIRPAIANPLFAICLFFVCFKPNIEKIRPKMPEGNVINEENTPNSSKVNIES